MQQKVAEALKERQTDKPRNHILQQGGDNVVPTLKYGEHTYTDRDGQECKFFVEEREGKGPLITCSNGGIIDIVPPIPTDPAWWERVIKTWSKIAYEENARILREQQANG